MKLKTLLTSAALAAFMAGSAQASEIELTCTNADNEYETASVTINLAERWVLYGVAGLKIISEDNKTLIAAGELDGAQDATGAMFTYSKPDGKFLFYKAWRNEPFGLQAFPKSGSCKYK